MVNEEPKKKAQEIFQEAYKLQMAGHIEEAIQQYQKSIDLCPTAEAYTFLGWTFSFKKRYEDAIKACEEAIKVDPDFGNPYNDIGAYLIELGRPEEAVEWFIKAIGAKRYDSYCYPHYNLGRVYEQGGHWMKAIECYEHSVAENPNYHLAQKSLNHLRALLN